MIDHFNLPVENIETSARFYEPVLSTLGITLLARDKDAIGFGNDTWEFGIVAESVVTRVHFAFVANSREQVREFYTTALEAGGHDNGSPGVRPEYGSTYYCAYVLDPDGHNVEAVCRK